jgi:hypothetical protein
MSPVRTFNVLTLTTILLLAGCFGLGDSAEAAEEADDTTVTATLTAQDIADAMTLSSNSPPEITVKTYSFDENEMEYAAKISDGSWEVAGYLSCPPEEGWDDLPATFAEQEAGMSDIGIILPEFISSDKCIAKFAFASVDPDGDTMTKGIDLDLDGLIDIPIVPANGQVIFGMDNSSLYDWPVFIGLEEGDARIANVALIAIDEHGASTAEIIHFLAPCNDCDDDDDDGGLILFQFSDRDAAGGVTASGGDDLIHVQMMQGQSLSWDLLGVSIIVDGGTMNNCVEASDADVDGLQCTYTLPNSFSAWEVGEEITISEGANADLCDGTAGYCEVAVTLTREVDGAGMVIAMFTAVAE